MADPSAPVPAAAADCDEELEIELVNPDQELAALITWVSELSKLAVDLSERCINLDNSGLSKLALNVTRHCLDLHGERLQSLVAEQVPRVVRLKVDAAISEVRSGRGDNQPWYVVWVGCQPGLFATYEEANDQVNSVPNTGRRRIVGRVSALAYYRHLYDTDQVMRLDLVPGVA
ncbi:hypothetical protein DFH08DRAFT_820436 [Mycena albidolilacea]|uniref:Ribonuclease H1 N-terminal domain-containing protein n=1 Tax=Mycena albidolilacea TaxID=1033008 RepID=A0AAD6ZC17_9AGAR|nr:hypothetical protein DFH08DRAFT_820436 [Mycena albidolilacea]